MKKFILFFYLVASVGFAQNNHFKAENKKVFWHLSYKTAEKNVMKLIQKNNPRILVQNDETGTGSKLLCNFESGSWYFEQYFDLKFSLEFINGGYDVVVSDIVFDGEGETNTYNGLENYVLKLGQNKFHETDKNKINLMCLNTYFTKLFRVANAEVVE